MHFHLCSQKSMKHIILRALEPEDIDDVYRWENNPEVWDCSAVHVPFSRHALTQYIMDCGQIDIYSAKQLRLMAQDGENTVGCVDLFDYDPYHRRAGLGMLIDRQFRGMGYGRPIVEALECFARKNLQLHQLYCDISVENTPCLKLFDNCGFERQGIRKDWTYQDGRWVDAVLFAKIL